MKKQLLKEIIEKKEKKIEFAIVTNLENGLSVIVKINDRHNDNSSIIQVSRKVAQLLRFYKSKITRVKVEILAEKVKNKSISEHCFVRDVNEYDYSKKLRIRDLLKAF